MVRILITSALVVVAGFLTGCGPSAKTEAAPTTYYKLPETRLPLAELKERLAKPPGDSESAKVMHAKMEAVCDKLAPINDALGKGDFAEAGRLATPELRDEMVLLAAEAGTNAENAKDKEEKDFWQTLLDILMTILRILTFLFQIFGSSGGGDTGAGKGGGSVPVKAQCMLGNGENGLVAGKDGGSHLVSLRSGNLLIARDGKPGQSVKLPLANADAKSVQVRNVAFGERGGFPVQVDLVSDGNPQVLEFEAEGGKAKIRAGK